MIVSITLDVLLEIISYLSVRDILQLRRVRTPAAAKTRDLEVFIPSTFDYMCFRLDMQDLSDAY